MNVKELLESVEESVFEIGMEASEYLRAKMCVDVVEQLSTIRDVLGLPIGAFEDCSDILYECIECGADYCGCCGEMVEDGFLCHDCKERRAGEVSIAEMSQV
jgi:hypothetical protein